MQILISTHLYLESTYEISMAGERWSRRPLAWSIPNGVWLLPGTKHYRVSTTHQSSIKNDMKWHLALKVNLLTIFYKNIIHTFR